MSNKFRSLRQMSHIERRLRDKHEGRHRHLQNVEREEDYYDAPTQVYLQRKRAYAA